MDNLPLLKTYTPWAQPTLKSSNGAQPSNSNFSTNGQGPMGQGASLPQDLFSGSPMLVAAPKGAQIQAHLAAVQAEKDKAIAALMKQGVGAPSGSERTNLTQELSSIDTDVLNLVAKNGTKMGVASPGDNLVELGAITPLTQRDVEARKPLWNAGARAVTNASSDLVAARERLDEFKSKGGDLKSEEGRRLSQEARKSDDRHEDAWMDQPEHGQVRPLISPLREFSDKINDSFGAQGPAMMQQQQLMMTQLPSTVSLETVASSRAGAQTPQEIKQFTDIVKSMNASELPGIAERGKEALTQQAGSLDFKGMMAKQELQTGDGKTFVNWDSEAMLLPDLHYHRDREPLPAFGSPAGPEAKPGAKPSIMVDGHDKRVIDGWGNGTTTMVDTKTEAMANGGGYTAAQHFRKQNLVLFREGEEKSGVHELGHVVEGILEKKDPKWYGQWSDRVEAAFDGKRDGGGHSITEYALNDPGEYVAEGFSHYYEDPKALKEKDPVLFGLTEEMIKRARELGRQ